MERSDTVAVIDVGSNSIKLLVARAAGASVETVFTHTIETRISEGISEAVPELDDSAMAAGVATIFELYEEALGYSPVEMQIGATSAVRDAINGMDFAMMVMAATGIEMRVLSGEEEATYIGRGIACDPALKGVGSFIQMDIGGGSLELIRFDGGEIQKAISLQLGAVRLTEMLVPDKQVPLSVEKAEAIRVHVISALERSGFDFNPKDWPMVATGGAFVISRSMLAAKQGLKTEESPAVLTKDMLRELFTKISLMPLVERITVPGLPVARADIAPTALVTILAVLEYAGREEISHSFYNLRYGMAAAMLGVSGR